MRITHPMVSSQMLMNINRNMRRLDSLYRQESTGKLIQYPSENPILAGRALKFRTALSDTEQYQRNVKQGLSWMEVTNGSFINIQNTILERLKELSTVGASDASGTWEDRQKMATEIQGLIGQLAAEMNVTYAGRYVFSGLRTDMPPVFQTTDNALTYQINQYFKAADIEKTKALQKIYSADIVNVGKGAAITNVTDGAGNPVTVTTKKMDEPDAYIPQAGEVNYIAETGEVIIGEGVDTTAPNFEVTYTGGDNASPKTTFNTTLVDSTEPILSNVTLLKLPYKNIPLASITLGKYDSTAGGRPPSNAPITTGGGVTAYPLTIPPALPIGNIVQKSLNDTDAYKPAPNTINYIPETGELVLSDEMLQEISSYSQSQSLVINYTKTGFAENEPNPIVYFDCTNKTVGSPFNGNSYTMDGQQLEFEFGANTKIPINVLAKDVYTSTMYADLVNFADFVKGVSISDEKKLVDKYKFAYPLATGEEINTMVQEQLTREKKLLETALHDRFKNMIDMAQGYMNNSSFQETDLGVRMNRLELISDRLQQDKDTYKELLSDNEDADFMEILMELSSAESVYMASLKTGANILKMTLADYI